MHPVSMRSPPRLPLHSGGAGTKNKSHVDYINYVQFRAETQLKYQKKPRSKCPQRSLLQQPSFVPSAAGLLS